MNRILLALLLALALPAAAQSRRITLSVQFDEAAADPATGLMPARAVVVHTGGSGPVNGGIVLRSLHPQIAELVVPESNGWRCNTRTAAEARCIFPTIEPRTQAVFEFFLRFPSRAGRARIDASVGWSMGLDDMGSASGDARPAMWRRFAVTNANDDGAGSLRAAIAAVNTDPACASLPCRIDIFGPAVIQPHTAFPSIVAMDVEVATNGAPVELLGTTVAQGSGLHFRAAEMAVRGVAITRFPDHGIYYAPSVRGSRLAIEQCSITGNGGRGIVVGEGILRDSSIRDNYIGGNARSGVFVVTDVDPALPLVPVLTIARNAIGGNGASGIYFGPRVQQMLVVDNTIAHNAHSGIAVAQGGQLVRIGANRITANGQIGIDYHLNGPSGAFDLNDRGAVATLQSATYEPATNTTTIVGTGPRDLGWLTFDYAFYANGAADAEGEEYLGSARGGSDGRVTLTVPRDLRGKYITAAITRGMEATFFETYELSAPLRVD